MKKVINGIHFEIIQIDNHEFKITSFENDSCKYNFNLILRPNSYEELLPTYQLKNKKTDLPEEIIECIPNLSEWISKQKNDKKFQ